MIIFPCGTQIITWTSTLPSFPQTHTLTRLQLSFYLSPEVGQAFIIPYLSSELFIPLQTGQLAVKSMLG